MSLTYDQRSELRYAFDEAYVEPERRRACRIRHKVLARVAPWDGRSPSGDPLQVTIEDFSTTGVGLVHTEAMRAGQQFLLEVPRPERKPFWVVLRVARCIPMDDGMFGVGLEAIELVDMSKAETNPFEVIAEFSCKAVKRVRKVTKRTKILFASFGIMGTVVAAFLT